MTQAHITACGGTTPCEGTTGDRSHGVHPIAVVQNEYSLLYRLEAEETLRPTRDLGITFVAYSPLGRGLLTATVEDAATLADNDARKRHPRFAAGNIAHNLDLVHRVAAIAQRKNCTPGQLALAWLLAQGPDIIPIPGTKRKERLLENIGALAVSLTAADIAEISSAIRPASPPGCAIRKGR